jgi:hypothetical protein
VGFRKLRLSHGKEGGLKRVDASVGCRCKLPRLQSCENRSGFYVDGLELLSSRSNQLRAVGSPVYLERSCLMLVVCQIYRWIRKFGRRNIVD